MSQLAYADNEAQAAYSLLNSVKAGKPHTSLRLRYENVNQDGFGPAGTLAANKELSNGEGLTLRSLIGWQTAAYQNFSLGAQVINVTKFIDNFNDSTNNTRINAGSNQLSNVEYAKIIDPDYTGVNLLYLDWAGIKNTEFRLGRQQVNLDNVRFIGDIGFRQVMQVFDGASVLNKSIPEIEVYLAHYESVRQINTKLRTDGALEIANIRYRISPTEFLIGYGYLSSFNDLGYGNAWFGAGAVNTSANQSNKTFGLRLDGVHPFNPNLHALYTAEHAKQNDYSGGDSRIDAHYYKLGGGVGIDSFSIRIDQELLSSNNSQYAFQTPFGTNHLFQGWVDKFIATPKVGISDTFVTATYKYDDFVFFADYHILNADNDFAKVTGGTGDKYGTEWNVAATYNYNKNIITKLEYGKFSESDQYLTSANRIRDAEKLWLTAIYTF